MALYIQEHGMYEHYAFGYESVGSVFDPKMNISYCDLYFMGQ